MDWIRNHKSDNGRRKVNTNLLLRELPKASTVDGKIIAGLKNCAFYILVENEVLKLWICDQINI